MAWCQYSKMDKTKVMTKLVGEQVVMSLMFGEPKRAGS